MQYRIRFQIWLVPASVVMSVALAANPANGQQYRIEPAKVYVKMDFWDDPEDQSAEAWHFDPNNNGE